MRKEYDLKALQDFYGVTQCWVVFLLDHELRIYVVHATLR